jgi:CRISPR-associated protein Csm4
MNWRPLPNISPKGDRSVYWMVKLKFTSPLHVGETAFGEENVATTIRSDTLFSAICAAYSALYSSDACSEWIREISRGERTFRVTSGFPFIEQSGEHVFYCPKPAMPPPGFEDEAVRLDYAKLIKKTQYVPLSLCVKWLHRQAFDKTDFEAIEAKQEEIKSISTVYRRPKVAVGREDHRSELYMQARVVFAPNTGLYVMLETTEEDVPRVMPCFRWLGDVGIGGKKSTGHGRFIPEFVPISNVSGSPAALFDYDLSQANRDAIAAMLRGCDSANAHVLLSLYYPTEAEREQDWHRASVQWLERRGWSQGVRGHQRQRASVRMIAEGSLIPFAPMGRLADVTPTEWQEEHPVYRSGIAFAVPAVQPGEDVHVT